MYSLQDLIDLANDVLLPELTRIHASFALHIKTDCQVICISIIIIIVMNQGLFITLKIQTLKHSLYFLLVVIAEWCHVDSVMRNFQNLRYFLCPV